MMVGERKWKIIPVVLEYTMYTSEDLGLGKFEIQIVLV